MAAITYKIPRASLSKRERFTYLFYLLGVLSISLFLLSYLLFQVYDFNQPTSLEVIVDKMRQEKQFLYTQREVLQLMDKAYAAIRAYDPSSQAVYLENDIKNQLEAIHAYYEARAYDVRYKAFYHAFLFYQMHFSDKKLVADINANIEAFKQQIKQCQLGTQEEEAMQKRVASSLQEDSLTAHP